MGPEFFLQTFFSLVITEVWDFTVDKIKKVYKEHRNVPENQKTFQSRMYTAIIDAFCMYTGVNSDEAQDDVMEFIYRTAKEYYDQSYEKKDTTAATLLSSINILESRFGNTLLSTESIEDDKKISIISDYLQVYIANDPGFRHIYVIKSLDDLKSKGYQIEKNQLEFKLFAKEEIDKAVRRVNGFSYSLYNTAVFRINSHTDQMGDRVIAAFNDKFDTFVKEFFTNTGTTANLSLKAEKIKLNDAKAEYAAKWKQRLFLHRRPEDRNLTLKNTFIMPAYYLISASVFQPSFRLFEQLEHIKNNNQKNIEEYDDLEEVLIQFITDGNSMLILGQPGMGKSSIICYLADKYIDDPQLLILKFKELNIKKSIDQEINSRSILLDSIINYLHCTKKDLENKVLILDGYDEIDSYFFDNDLFSDFFLAIREINNFKFLITSRENYIIKAIHHFEKVLFLLPFNVGKIRRFANKITSDENSSIYISYNDNNKVFGIPVILYMALATGVDFSKLIGRMEAYNRIFSLNGGIFDRFYSQNNDSYEKGSHAISYVKNTFYNILSKTAYYMFEYFNDNSIPHEAYEKIIDNEKTKAKELLAKSSELNSPLWYDFPIENLYEKTDAVSFIHKSFYEFFTAEYFFNIICSISENVIKQNLSGFGSNEETEKIISLLSDLLCENVFSVEILEFLQYKIDIHFTYEEKEKLREFYTIIFRKMLDKGMTYKLNKSIKYNTLFAECIIFANILDLLHLWINYDFYPKYIEFDAIEVDKISVYLHLCSLINTPYAKGIFKIKEHFVAIRLNLSHFNLDGINLEHIQLNNINFSRSSMKNSNLDYSILENSNFKYAELQHSSLIGADLSGSFFREAFLSYSNITNANLENSAVPDANFTGCIAKKALFRNVCDLESAVYTNELDDAILK